MAGYTIVPQHLVDVLAPALSTDANRGAILAETVLRDASAGDLVQKLVAGVELSDQELSQLPPLVSGRNWQTVAQQLRGGVRSLDDAMQRIAQLETQLQQQQAPRSEVPQ